MYTQPCINLRKRLLVNATSSPSDDTPKLFIPYPQGLGRALLRSPILLQRLGFGRLLDLFHIMILTTRGHRSGQPRYTPVEYRRHGRKYYVISAWGSRPHWFRNLSADANATLCQGKRTFAARAQVVESSSEALMVLHLFRRPNPLVYDAILARVGNVQALDPRQLPDLAHQYTIIRFDPQTEDPVLPSPPDDLRWVVWAAGVFGLLLVILGVLRTRNTQETEAHND